MRKKIREIMNKEEGFTLVELLAVIVILGIIVAIAIPAVGNVIGTAEDGADEAQTDLVVDAARLYVTTDENFSLGEDNSTDIKVSELITRGYLEERGSENFDSNDVVKVTKNGEIYNYSYGDYKSSTPDNSDQ